ncbi:MAG TPA: orotate phosphoribosyltransferase [Bryobacteraceae bacterium]|nr:orotate phosphoribosyltransferase [Bryobacteraceae bacterium]
MTPQAESVMEMFRSSGAYLEGHFRLTSGLHSGAYMQCALVLQYPDTAEKLGRMLARELRQNVNGEIQAVASPALGGMIIGHEVARALGARHIFTERDPATRQMKLRRGFLLRPGEAAVVVEDVITTGGSTQEVVDLLRAGGARVLGAGSIIDRSGGEAAVGVPRVALATLRVASYEEAACPLCRSGAPIVKPGSRPSEPDPGSPVTPGSRSA